MGDRRDGREKRGKGRNHFVHFRQVCFDFTKKFHLTLFDSDNLALSSKNGHNSSSYNNKWIFTLSILHFSSSSTLDHRSGHHRFNLWSTLLQLSLIIIITNSSWSGRRFSQEEEWKEGKEEYTRINGQYRGGTTEGRN